MPSGADRVALAGGAMVGLVRALAALAATGVGRYVVVGGVAVAARLGEAHRATLDVDTVVDDTRPPDVIDALLERDDTRGDPDDPGRVLVAGTPIEVLRIEPVEQAALDGLDPGRDALFASAHSWALETATPLMVIAAANPRVEASVPFATPAALVAMKLHAIQSRRAAGPDKRPGDAWDIYRLLLDLDRDGGIRDALHTAAPALRSLVADAANRVLVSGARRTAGWLQSGDDHMAVVTTDQLRYLGEQLVAGLR